MTNTTETKFTAAMARTMTAAEVVEFWRTRQQNRRDAGLDHYDTLIDPDTDEIVATI